MTVLGVRVRKRGAIGDGSPPRDFWGYYILFCPNLHQKQMFILPCVLPFPLYLFLYFPSFYFKLGMKKEWRDIFTAEKVFFNVQMFIYHRS